MKFSNKIFFLYLVFCSENINCLPQEEFDQKLELNSDSSEKSGSVINRAKHFGKDSISNFMKKIPFSKTEKDKPLANSPSENIPGGQDDLGPKDKSNFWVSVPVIKNILGRTCFKDIGCFSATEYQDIKRRPIPLIPMAPEVIDPTFHIFSPKNTLKAVTYGYNATSDQLKTSVFDPNLNTIMITHGFRSGFEPWMNNLKDSIFNETKKFNIICVVWEKGSKVSMYHLAATNTRVVGALMAYFITTLVKTFAISNDKFHLIGHSIGAHVVGYAGKRLNDPQLGRITGLDPSGPGFHFENKEMRLHYSDATLVDAFHTDIGMIFSEGLGVMDKFGYYDFYPNGGLEQPGCKSSKGIFNIIQAIKSGDDISCSHSRAHRFAVNLGFKSWSDCQPIAYECTDYETFIEGRCFDCREDRCQPMGINAEYWLRHSPDPRTLFYRYYINLAANEEFCVFHYQFAFHITEDSDEATGLMDFTLVIKKSDKKTEKLNFYKIMSGTQIGEIHTLLMTFQFKLIEVKSMAIEWKRLLRPEDKKRENKGKKMKIPFIEINFMSHLDQKIRNSSSFFLCPKDGPDTELRPNNVKIAYTMCNGYHGLDRATQAVAEVLTPFTRREDLFSNDFDRLNSVVRKVANSNLMNKTRIVNLFG